MSIVYNTVKKYCHWPWNWGYDVHAAGQHPMMGQSTDSKGQILQPADAIRFDCGGFQHWGVYVGEGQVVHMTAKGVEKAYVQEVANECPYFKDNSFDKVQGPFMTQGILNMANTRVGEKSYNFLSNNCENFVNQVRCGNAKSKQVDEYLQSHHVDNFDFVDYGPGGKAIRTTFFKTNGGQFSQSSTFVDASSAGGGQGEGHVVQQEGSGTEHGHAQTIVTGQGAASASSSGPGGTITVISMPGGAYTPVPMQLGVPSSGPPGSIIKEDLSCPVCLGQNAPTKE